MIEWTAALIATDGRRRRKWRWGSPPACLRRFVSWRLLHWLDGRYDLCWAELVMWKMGYGGSWETVSMSCMSGHPDGWDYCNKWEPLGEVPAMLKGAGLEPLE